MSRFVVTVVMTFCLGILCDARNTRLKMPSQCVDMEFCKHKHREYPTNIIKALLEDRIHRFEEKHINMGDRLGPEDKVEENVCETDRDFGVIYEIIDDQDELRFVVQMENKFTQTIKTEICLHPGKMETARSVFSSIDVKEFEISCDQKYVDYKFLVLKHDRQGFELVSMKKGVPVCCSCRANRIRQPTHTQN